MEYLAIALAVIVLALAYFCFTLREDLKRGREAVRDLHSVLFAPWGMPAEEFYNRVWRWAGREQLGDPSNQA